MKYMKPRPNPAFGLPKVAPNTTLIESARVSQVARNMLAGKVKILTILNSLKFAEHLSCWDFHPAWCVNHLFTGIIKFRQLNF